MSDRAGTPASGAPDTRGGVLAALGCYGMWGGFPLLFRLLEGVAAPEIVAHRVVWSLLTVGVVLSARRRMGEVWAVLRDRKAALGLLASTLVLSSNWLIFVWAVNSDRVLEISFGYFINPLVYVALGMVLLGERQNLWQSIAIGIAAVAVVIQAIGIGGVPWVSLALAFSFGFYGYFRKTVAVGSAPGFFVETLFMVPVAVAYLTVITVWQGPGVFADPARLGALILTGPATAMALIFFAYAARRLRLTTLGVFQYLAPSMHFLIAIWLFGEPLNAARLASFGLIWVSLAVFTWDSWRRQRPRPPVEAARLKGTV